MFLICNIVLLDTKCRLFCFFYIVLLVLDIVNNFKKWIRAILYALNCVHKRNIESYLNTLKFIPVYRFIQIKRNNAILLLVLHTILLLNPNLFKPHDTFLCINYYPQQQFIATFYLRLTVHSGRKSKNTGICSIVV